MESRLYGPDFLGTVQLTIAVRDLVGDPEHRWRWDPEARNASAYARVDCEAPLEGLQIWLGHEVAMFDEHSMKGGLGTQAEGASASVADGASHRVVSNKSAVFAVTYIGSVGSLLVTHPAGRDPWVFRPEQNAWGLQDGPGLHEVTLAYAGQTAASFFAGAIVGWEPMPPGAAS